MQAKVEKLFVKYKTDDAMSGVKSIVIKNFKIVGQKETQPFRTCLLVSREQASLFGCKAGDFRENICNQICQDIIYQVERPEYSNVQ